MKDTEQSKNFKWSHLPSLVKNTYSQWMSEDPFRLSAVVAYYAVLSLPALLIIILNVVGSIWGAEVVRGELTQEFTTALGADAAKSIEDMITESQNEDKNLISTIVGIGMLLFGATGVFYQLKISLNQIWNIEPKPNTAIKKMIIDRAQSFAFIIALGFLLLTSFVLTAGITALSNFITSNLPDVLLYVAYGIDIVFSVGIITLLFALMFRYLPDVIIKWRTVWKGAFITACLFVLGKLLLSFYFAESDPGSTYGAAGTVVLILLWVSYSCLILFFGASFTKVYADRYGYGIQPSGNAVKKEK